MIYTGIFYGTANFGGTSVTSANANTYVVKYAASGSLSWVRAIGGGVNNFGNGVAVDGSNNVITTGKWSGTADFGDGVRSSVGGTLDVFVLKYAP